MIAFTKRTVKIYFRDKTSVFFSLFAVFIIIGMYLLFLGDVMSSDMEIKESRALMDSWIMAGILAVASLTTTMGAFGIMVEDKHKKIYKDFYSSPIKRSRLAGGYVFGSFIIGVIMSVIAFVIIQIYFLATGTPLLAPLAVIKVLGLIIISTLMNTAMLYLLVSFIKSQNAFGTASSIIGTLVGFLAGIYIPIGNMPAAIQGFIKVFPLSHTAMLFRRVMMEETLAVSFEGAPAEAVAEFREILGVDLVLFEKSVPSYAGVIFILAAAGLFFGLSVLSLSRKAE